MRAKIHTPIGPLADDTLYIERKADSELLGYVHSMEYVMVIAPRQQGKTSLIRHLIATLSKSEWCFVYVDVGTLDTQSEPGWYRTLSRRVCQALKTTFPDPSSSIPQNSVEWRDFLSEMAGQARQEGKKIMVVLDEIGGAKFDNNNLFFTTLREVYTTRQVLMDSEFHNMSFILAGSFNPQDLIQDFVISPFNVAQKINLADFSLEEVQELMVKRGWEKEQAQKLALGIHYWTDGQPYLTQLICSYLEDKETLSDMDGAIEKLYREDVINLPHVIKGLKANADLRQYIEKNLSGESDPFFPQENLWQNRLYLLGLIKANEQGFCSIRNRVYEKIIRTFLNTDIASNVTKDESHPSPTCDGYGQTSPNNNLSIDKSPDQPVDFVFVTALPEERNALMKKLDFYQLPPDKSDTRTYFKADLPATFPGGVTTCSYRVILMQLLGMGRVQAALATADAIRRWHPRYILLIGIAGGMASQGINLGDILLANQIVDYELQKLTSNGPQIRWETHQSDPQLLGVCQAYLGSNYWLSLLSEKRPGSGETTIHIGPIASGDKVIAFGEVLARYSAMWPKLIGVEMEASGVAAAAFQSSEKPGFFMIRCVSDLADEEKGSPKVNKWRSYAYDAAASFAISILKNGPVTSKG